LNACLDYSLHLIVPIQKVVCVDELFYCDDLILVVVATVEGNLGGVGERHDVRGTVWKVGSVLRQEHLVYALRRTNTSSHLLQDIAYPVGAHPAAPVDEINLALLAVNAVISQCGVLVDEVISLTPTSTGRAVSINEHSITQQALWHLTTESERVRE
jgi:hypothetical protein